MKESWALEMDSRNDGVVGWSVYSAEHNVRTTPILPTFAELVDQAPDAVILVDADGVVVYANRCVVQLFGVELADLIGLAIEILIPEFGRAQQLHTTAIPRVALKARHADGHALPIDVRFTPIERHGRSWTLAAIRDVSDQHRILDEVHAARRAAEDTARVKGDFLDFAAHDLSQPVQTLELILNAIAQRAQQSPEIAELSTLATMSLARMRELLKMLLDISRIESGSLQIHEQPLAVSEVYNFLERQFSPVARAKGLAFVTEPSPHIIEADPTLLRGMLSNFVANAIRFTPSGEVRLRATSNADGTLCLSVRDTGVGIPAEHLQTIFQDFRRLEPIKLPVDEGFGLGLGIVRRLSDLLGFPVTVQSTVGAGSAFGIEIPGSKTQCVA